jgi:hypothetical protein
MAIYGVSKVVQSVHTGHTQEFPLGGSVLILDVKGSDNLSQVLRR